MTEPILDIMKKWNFVCFELLNICYFLTNSDEKSFFQNLRHKIASHNSNQQKSKMH